MPRRSSVRRPAHDLPSGPITTSHATVELTTDKADPNGVMLLIDGAESSYLDRSDPTHLVFEYMQQMMAVLEETMTPGRVRAVHLGAAGCALARAVEARWPGSRQIAVEWAPWWAATSGGGSACRGPPRRRSGGREGGGEGKGGGQGRGATDTEIQSG